MCAVSDELHRALPDVVANRAGVRNVEDEKIFLVRIARRIAQTAERSIDADPREPRARELHRRTRARHDRALPRPWLHAAIDERPIAAGARSREDDRRKAILRHRLPRQRDDDVRRFAVLKDRFALRVEHPHAAVLRIRRRPALVVGHVDGCRVHAIIVEHLVRRERRVRRGDRARERVCEHCRHPRERIICAVHREPDHIRHIADRAHGALHLRGRRRADVRGRRARCDRLHRGVRHERATERIAHRARDHRRVTRLRTERHALIRKHGDLVHRAERPAVVVVADGRGNFLFVIG